MRNTYLNEEFGQMYAPIVSLPISSIRRAGEWNLVKIALRIVTLIAVLMLAEFAFAIEQKNLISVPVLKEQLAKGTLIKNEHLGTREINPSNIAKTVILNKEEIIGLEATRTLRSGNPIYQGYVRVSPDIHQNQNISMNYNADGIMLSTKGRALEDGNIGANIRIMNTNSKKIVIGTVIAKNRVSVE